MAQSSAGTPVVKAYWQPGCTSCLRMKEFLTQHGVPFVSVNVLEDKDAFEELAALGVRSVPIIRRGSEWANGQVLRDVARIAGVPWGGTQVLPPPELAARLVAIQNAAHRLFTQIPDDKTGRLLPHRPRSYAQLAYHTFNIADAFLEHEVQGLPLKEGVYGRIPPPEMDTKAKILAYGQDVRERFEAWWEGLGPNSRRLTQGRRLLRRRHRARIPRTHDMAFRAARAPARHGARHARHRARPSYRPRDVCWFADARKGLGRRTADGLNLPAGDLHSVGSLDDAPSGAAEPRIAPSIKCDMLRRRRSQIRIAAG